MRLPHLDLATFDLAIPTQESRQLDIERAEAEAALLTFALGCWVILEPGRVFVDGWHIKVICTHLEAVASGLIKRLLITMPPRHMKSLLVSVIFPLWVWLKKPGKRFFCASYDMGLSLELALKMKRLIESEWFQERWGHRVTLKTDQDAKGFFETTATGYRYSTAINGGGTGRGADIGIIDDPHNVKAVESDLKRKHAHEFYHAVLSTRGNDPALFAIIVVCQRTHEDDLVGHIEETEIKDLTEGIDWQWVDLPARFDLDKKKTVLGTYDPRTAAGELLWPARFTRQEINKLAKTLGPYREAAQLDQKPSIPGGGLFKRDHFQLEQDLIAGLEIVRAWDIAATEQQANEDPDYSVGVLLGRDRAGEWWLLDVVRERTDDTDSFIEQTAVVDGADVPICLPKDPAAAGKLWLKAITARLEEGGFEVRSYSNSGSKVTRASAWAGSVKAGEWHILDREWTEPYLREVAKFWVGKHDDQVDATSTGVEAILTDGGGWQGAGAITSEDINKLPGLRGGR